ncbi:MAG: nitroreductase family protein [Chloroflexota bacterium]
MPEDPEFPWVPLQFERLSQEEMLHRSRHFLHTMQGRRTVRSFSPEPVPFEIIENAIVTAGTAPSGAHQQPWTFVVVSDPVLKVRIREAAEREEKEFYQRRIPDEWREALRRLGTDWVKEHMTAAPYIIVVFGQAYGLHPDGQGGEKQVKHYYMPESVGIAAGFLLASLRLAGLVALTHTPSPMGFLREILGRPRNERPYVVIPVGYPAPDCRIPNLGRKSLSEIMVRL